MRSLRCPPWGDLWLSGALLDSVVLSVERSVAFCDSGAVRGSLSLRLSSSRPSGALRSPPGFSA
eukprot:8459406-Alexandrium_andersonii.AAC.1